jgi:trigger factor
MVYVNLEGFTTQGPIEAANRENFPTIVGLARAGVPEVVNDALVDMNAGDEKDITDTLPDDYPIEELRGLDATYHVTVLSMKEQELPDLDEEFAKKVGYETVEELREAVERNLKRRAEETTESQQLDTIIEQLVSSSEVDVPDVMVNEELDAMLKNLEARLRDQYEQRITLRQYFTFNGITEAEWREASRERARERVIRTQVLSEFARREGISVDEDEVTGEINTILERFEGKEREDAQKVLGAHEARHDLEDRLFQQKIVERLIGIAEGKLEAAKAEDTTQQADDAASTGTEEAGSAADLTEAGGAAELLGTEGVDTDSANETGDAPGGGTPTTAPGVSGEDAKS